MNMTKEMLVRVIADAYEVTILELAEDAITRIQSNTDHREYVEKQTELVAACLAELKRRKAI